MIDEDRQYLKEALFSGGGNRIGSVICVGPGVGTVGEAPICEVIDDTLVGVLL